MSSLERKEFRYQRRKALREQKKIAQQNVVGTLEEAITYSRLYRSGKRCCKGVRWKTSTKHFELHLLSRTAVALHAVLNGTWKIKPTTHFMLAERGHIRPIDAPHINDRQIEKAFCQYVLRPLYWPHLIYDNGASMVGKGFSFAIDRVKQFIHEWYRRCGAEGVVVTLDIKSFFPSAPHDTVKRNHTTYILDNRERFMADRIVNSFGNVGMFLGVEPSQTEATMLPNKIDHLLKDKLRLHYVERYMDDIFFIVRTIEEARNIIRKVNNMAECEHMKLNESKTQIKRITEWFTYCQWRFRLTDTGRLIIKPSRRSITNLNRKMKKLAIKYGNKEIALQEINDSFICWRSYIEKSNHHNILLRAVRLFYALYGVIPQTPTEKRKTEALHIAQTKRSEQQQLKVA